MPAPSTLLAFGLAAAVLIAIPGPSVLFVIGRALALGRAGALLSVAGNASGVMLQVIAVSVGLGVLLDTSAVLLTVLRYAGAAFLVYLGIQAIRHRRAVDATESSPAAAGLRGRSRVGTYLEGVTVGLTNPKSLLFFVAVLPQFVRDDAGPVPLQLLLFGAIFVVLALLFDSAWAIGAAAARDWFARSPRRAERLGVAGGVAMIGLGAILAVTGTKH